jgi:hypothetical protein
MRKTVIATSLAVVALGGLAGSIASASGSDADPASPPETTPGLDILSGLGLDPDQLQCLAESFGTVDVTDFSAMSELMDQCGVSIDQLLQIGDPSAATVEDEAPETTEAVTVTAVATTDIDPAAAAAALEAFGVDADAVECLVSEAATVSPGDQQAAELAFIACEIGPAEILAGIVALDAAASGTESEPPGSAVDVAPPASVESTGNPMLDIVLEQLAAAGVVLDDEQRTCLEDSIADVDLTDITAITALLETCNIDLSGTPGG